VTIFEEPLSSATNDAQGYEGEQIAPVLGGLKAVNTTKTRYQRSQKGIRTRVSFAIGPMGQQRTGAL